MHEIAEQHNHSQNCDDDLCTPFCSCSCCHTSVTVAKIPIYYSSVIEIVNTETINVYIECFSTPHYNTLFRPPIS